MRLPVYPLQYGDISGNYTNILFIDNAIDDLDKIIESINSDTFYIVYSGNSSKIDLLNLLELLEFSNINRIGFFFKLSGDNKIFLDLKPFYDPSGNYKENYSTDSIDSNFDLLVEIINQYNIKNVDFLAFNTLQYQKWNDYYNELIEKTNVIVGASDNETGNIKYGGDWILESTGQDIEFIYFNKSIEYYKYLLDTVNWASLSFSAGIDAYNYNLYVGSYFGSLKHITQIPINANGTAGTKVTWYTYTSSLYAVCYYNGFIYTSIGPNAEGAPIIQIPVNANGTAGTANTTWITNVIAPFTMVGYGSYLFTSGNSDGIKRITINANNTSGGIINWYNITTTSIAIKNSVLYATLGSTRGIIAIPINANGSAGTPTTITTSVFMYGIAIHESYLYSNQYTANGTTTYIFQIPINANGTLGTPNTTWRPSINDYMLTVTQNPSGSYSLYGTHINDGRIGVFDLSSNTTPVVPVPPSINIGNSPTKFYYNNIDICNNFTSKTAVLNPLYNSSPFFTGFYTYYNGSYYDFAQVYNINSTLILNPLILNNMYTNYNGSYYELTSFFNPNTSVVSGSGSYTIVGSSNSYVSGSNYIYIFTSLSGTSTLTLNQSLSVTILCIGGGGGGGWDAGGGGGGGGVYTNTLTLTAGTYTITIGTGGASAYVTSAIGSNGGNSSFIGGSTNIICYGGGGGGNNHNTSPAGNGGNGGGQGATDLPNRAGTFGTGVTGQGNNGGAAISTSGGGGGGYSSVGGNASGPGGNGGNGILSSITGTDTWYGGGGGGGSWGTSTGGTGGLGGGGGGGNNSFVSPAGDGKNGIYYGGGGGGSGALNGTTVVAGNGYQGVCIISISNSYTSTNTSNTSTNNTSNTSTTPTPPAEPTLFSSLITPSTNWNGVFSLKLLVSSYTGFIIKIRRSSNNTFMSFYSTTSGVLTSDTGISIATFLSGSTGFVDTWYDQSGKGNHATQTTTSLQPLIDITNNCIDFGLTSGNYYLNMPSGTVPVGVLNASYSFVVKHGNARNVGNGGFIGAGNFASNVCNSFRFNGSNNQYWNYWYNNDFGFGNSVNKIPVVAAVTYDKATLTQRGYRDSLLTTTNTNRSGSTTAAVNQTIGVTNAGEYLQGQMYSLVIFSSSLPQADITILNSL